MNPDAQRWYELAQYDLGTADAMLSAGRYLYVLFCCQQAMEKHLKGLIVERCGIFPPRTHDLTKLAQTATITPDETQDAFFRTLTNTISAHDIQKKCVHWQAKRPENWQQAS